ncbi:DUF3291 domain-containing protein [Streptomyces sp. A5-4]|uniref:DUF3291 domain-containing protein n=1 Tax=Streptomyces sp. A5-4 TaxID=3384771 RepID=UPI003DA9E0AC
MPTVPWVTPNPAPPHTRAVVMASTFEVRSLKDVPRFFLKSFAAWRQLQSAPGVFGASLVARPTKRVFRTLSAWESRDAIHAYAQAEPHRGIMTGLRPTMLRSTFTFWEVPVEELPISWDEAERRLADQARTDAAEGQAS